MNLLTQQIGRNLYLIDLETGGFRKLICSYVLKGEKVVLIESGPTSSVPKLVEGLKELKVDFADIEYVAVTHVHLDHGGGAGTLMKLLPNAKVLVHPRGAPHLVDPGRLWESSQSVLGYVSGIFGKPEPVSKERIVPVAEGSFDLGDGGKLNVTETLGHASHNLSFFETFNDGVFPGDAAGTYLPEFDSVIPTSPPPFRLDAALASLDKLINLKPAFLYYSHFGKVSDAVKRLKDYKVQLQLWGRIALEGVQEKQSFDQICERILREDAVMNRIAGYLSDHPIYSVTALGNTIQGFVEYAKTLTGQTGLR